MGALPRGLKNRNPCNLEHGEDWLGLTDDQPDPRFCSFEDLAHGYRAAARVLMTYGRRGVSTPRAIAAGWAPRRENPTDAYAQLLAEFCRCGLDDALDLDDPHTLSRLLYAMTVMENLGAEIARGVALALDR